MLTRALSLPLALLVGVLVAPRAHAGCTLSQDASLVKKSLSRQIRCNDKRLRHGPAAPCSLTAAPACSGTLVNDAAALGYGPNNPPSAEVDSRALKAQLKCQRQIGKGISSYVGTKLKGLVKNLNIAALEPKAR